MREGNRLNSSRIRCGLTANRFRFLSKFAHAKALHYQRLAEPKREFLDRSLLDASFDGCAGEQMKRLAYAP